MIAVIDCGLSALKLSLLDEHGAAVEVISESYPTRHAADRAEQDPQDWWHALGRATHKLKRRTEVRALVPTGHMHGLVLLDASDRPLLPCLTLHDRRGAAEINSLDARSFYETTGQVLDASLPITKLLWLRRTDHELLARSASILAPKDYLRLLLTGEHNIDHVDAAGTGLYNLAARGWSQELVALTELPPTALVPIVESASIVGYLTGTAAAELGLPESLPVLAGVGDDVELLGATAHRERMAVEHVGTTGSILVTTHRSKIDPAGRIEIYPSCVSHTLAAGLSTSNAGSVVTWIEQKLDVRLEQAVAGREVGLIALPYLFGERGTVGLPFAGGIVFGLDGSTERADVAHALLLGIAFGLRDLLASVSSLTGPVDQLVSSGGGTAPLDWVRLRATAYGMPVSVMHGDPTAVGCAALGLAALDGGSPEQVARSLSRDMTTVEPDEHAIDEMNDHFLRYLELREDLLPIYAAAARPAILREAELA